MSVEGHAKLAFGVRWVSGIMLKQRRSSQFSRLPSRSPSLSPRSLPFGICLVKILAPLANRLLAISSSRLDSSTNSRRLQDPNEAFLGFVRWINVGNLSESLHLCECLIKWRAVNWQTYPIHRQIVSDAVLPSLEGWISCLIGISRYPFIDVL